MVKIKKYDSKTRHISRIKKLIKNVEQLPKKKRYGGGSLYTEKAVKELKKYLKFIPKYMD